MVGDRFLRVSNSATAGSSDHLAGLAERVRRLGLAVRPGRGDCSCRTRMRQHVPAATRRWQHMRKTAIVLHLLATACSRQPTGPKPQ